MKTQKLEREKLLSSQPQVRVGGYGSAQGFERNRERRCISELNVRAQWRFIGSGICSSLLPPPPSSPAHTVPSHWYTVPPCTSSEKQEMSTVQPKPHSTVIPGNYRGRTLQTRPLNPTPHPRWAGECTAASASHAVLMPISGAQQPAHPVVSSMNPLSG